MNNRETSGQKNGGGPLKATLPVSSLLRESGCSLSRDTTTFKYKTFSPTTLRHISPDLILSAAGNRSPGSLSYFKRKSPIITSKDALMRRTASLDTLMCPVWSAATATPSLIIHLNKSTQTEETITEGRTDSPVRQKFISPSSPKPLKTPEHSTGCTQTILSRTSPLHYGGKAASPVQIPLRTTVNHLRPMRNSVEGLNQEIEKLVLFPGQHSHRSRMELTRGTPEGHRAPLADLLQQQQSRSVNTQTPIIRDFDTTFFAHLSSDESHGNSPGDEELAFVAGCQFEKRCEKSGSNEASPRINKFLAQKPPDGCERVRLKLNSDDGVPKIIKPTVLGGGFQLKQSHGSAFHQLIVPQFCDEAQSEDGKSTEGEVAGVSYVSALSPSIQEEDAKTLED